MRMQDFSESYRHKTDEELLQLAAHPEQLTADALSALRGEMALRRLSATATTAVLDQTPRLARPQARAEASQETFGVRAFLVDVFQLYHAHCRFFFKFAFPTVLLSYLALVERENIVDQLSREIAHHGWSFSASSGTFAELWLVSLLGFVTSWLAFCYMFAAVGTGVDRILEGTTPSVRECLGPVNNRIGAFFRISVVLFVSLGALTVIAAIVDVGVLWAFQQFHSRLPSLLRWCIAIGSGVVSAVILSRFALAIPAVVLDHYSAKQAIFRSDELTEGKWTILAALVLKSLAAGYVAGMLPFWIRVWAWKYIPVPHLLAVLASIAGVALVEPTMFIGLALLYLRTSKSATSSGAIGVPQFERG